MGNKLASQRQNKERDRELQLRASHQETTSFERYKKFLPYLQSIEKLDDFSEEAVARRMDHKFIEKASNKKSNCLKRAVSLKKRRFENDLFDLDLAYISKKVIAMGYPSIGAESIYRNSRKDIISFMTSYHPTHYKIYNL